MSQNSAVIKGKKDDRVLAQYIASRESSDLWSLEWLTLDVYAEVPSTTKTWQAPDDVIALRHRSAVERQIVFAGYQANEYNHTKLSELR